MSGGKKEFDTERSVVLAAVPSPTGRLTGAIRWGLT